MAKKSKLLAALDAHKGRDYKLQKQKKLQKQAVKRKRSQVDSEDNAHAGENEKLEFPVNGIANDPEMESDGWQSDEEDAAEPTTISTANFLEDSSDSDSSLGGADNEDEEGEGEDGEDSDNDSIPLSDLSSLASSQKADLLPHTRLTINNTSALQKALSSITLPYGTLPFSAHQSLTTPCPPIPDPNDDLTRELAFYKQCLSAAVDGRTQLKKEGVPFSRPNDFFAEMVKSDEHMGQVKGKMVEAAAAKKAGAEARRQRDLRKFGKQVQVAKLQEREKEKKEMLGKVDLLKRKRKLSTNPPTQTTEETLFDVALDDAVADKKATTTKNGTTTNNIHKRRKKDEKFGFGGKKRFAKSGDAVSSADMGKFSVGKMKGGGAGGGKRLGKSRRGKKG